MPTRTLPTRPNLAQLKRQASELRALFHQANPSAVARIQAHHPRWPLNALKVSDSQLVIAREYGFESWPALKQHVEIASRFAGLSPHPRFETALAALDSGDIEGVRALIRAHPDLVTARSELEPPYHYFSGATLLHHIAGNPGRGPLPDNALEIARLLLQSGADVHASTLGPNGGTTMGLVLTSAQASQSGISGAMIDLLIEFGDSIDVRQPGVLVGSLVNHAPAAAAHLIRLGAKEDLFASAGLGRLENVQAAFEEDGKLKERQRWQGGFASSQDAIGLAMLVAYVQGCTEVVDFLLEKDGNWDVTGVNNGTALHQAAVAEDLEMVAKLVARGADASNRQNPFVASPISWADHFGLSEVTEWMGQHCRLDIHDAVSFGIHGQALLRLREDPASVNSRLDQWSIPQATPLHCAVVMKRVDMVELLLASGAEVNALAGNGLTALDLASQQEAPGILTQLLAAGGRRASEL